MSKAEKQKILNMKNSLNILETLLRINFKQKDYMLILTYTERVTDISRAKKDIQNYFRRLKRVYGDIKYIWLMERSRNGITFRIFIHSSLDCSVLTGIWQKGKARVFRIGNRFTISADTVTAPVLYRRWSASKNLKRPEY